jgi:hypothetical protein
MVFFLFLDVLPKESPERLSTKNSVALDSRKMAS